MVRRSVQPPPLGEYLTVGEAAEFLGVSASTLRNWDRTGKLRSVRNPMNDYRLYRRADLEAVLAALTAKGGRQQGTRRRP